jgi:hypothetical protein
MVLRPINSIMFRVTSRRSRCLATAMLVAAISTCILSLVGCGRSDWGIITGTVRVNGQPVGPGSMILEPVASGAPGAIAHFGADGKYKLMSSGKKDGARVGEYRVSITGGESAGDEVVDPKANTLIPARYSDTTTSKLTLTVEPGTKEVDFDLKL